MKKLLVLISLLFVTVNSHGVEQTDGDKYPENSNECLNYLASIEIKSFPKFSLEHMMKERLTSLPSSPDNLERDDCEHILMLQYVVRKSAEDIRNLKEKNNALNKRLQQVEQDMLSFITEIQKLKN